MNGSDAITGNNQLEDYSYIIETDRVGLLANCISSLGPFGSNDNSIVGGWYFKNRQVTNQGCSGGVKQLDSEYVGVRQLQQCGTFSTAAEGVYMCELLDSSFVQRSIRLGMYINGRSK